jgi:hypothetical protein
MVRKEAVAIFGVAAIKYEITWIIHEIKIKKYPLPSIPSRQWRGNTLLDYL